MTLPERRRYVERRAVARGGRRMEDWLPQGARPCRCVAVASAVGSGRTFLWYRCEQCGSVWAVRKESAVVPLQPNFLAEQDSARQG